MAVADEAKAAKAAKNPKATQKGKGENLLSLVFRPLIVKLSAANTQNATGDGGPAKEEWEGEIASMKPIHEQVPDGKFAKGFTNLCC